MNPASGHIKARGSVPALADEGGQLIGSAKAGRILYGIGPRGVIAIYPPGPCDKA